MRDVFGPSIVLGTVVGRPFSAKILAIRERRILFWRHRRVVGGVLARDGQGRVYTRYDSKQKTLFFTIADNVAGHLSVVDPSRRTLVKTTLGTSLPQGVFRPPEAETRHVEGLECFRVVVSGVVEEAWVSSELEQVIFERAVRDGVEFTWQLVDLTTGEPDRSLFEIPSNFTPIDSPGGHVVSCGLPT